MTMTMASADATWAVYRQTPVASLPFRGVVLELISEKNYGIITTADGLEVFFLRSSVTEGAFNALRPGSRVRFNLSGSILGLQARKVIPVGYHRSLWH